MLIEFGVIILIFLPIYTFKTFKKALKHTQCQSKSNLEAFQFHARGGQ